MKISNLILIGLLSYCSFSSARDSRLVDEIWYFQSSAQTSLNLDSSHFMSDLPTLKFSENGGFQLEMCNLLLANVEYIGLDQFQTNEFFNTFKNCESDNAYHFENELFDLFRNNLINNEPKTFNYNISLISSKELHLEITNELGKPITFTNLPNNRNKFSLDDLDIISLRDKNKIEISSPIQCNELDFKIFDLLGNRVTSGMQSMRSKKTQIDINSLKSGIYILAIESNNGNRRCYKFLK
ncbi:MAG: T9SS type A sorting domain-containing protein [Nonlabens sp.]